jgi:hypothetical protein
MLLDATVAPPPDLAENRVLARKVAKECRLADFEELDNVLDPGVFVPVFAEQANRGVDNLLPQPCFLTLAKAQRFSAAGSIGP